MWPRRIWSPRLWAARLWDKGSAVAAPTPTFGSYWNPRYWAARFWPGSYWRAGAAVAPPAECGFSEAFTNGYAVCPDGTPIPPPVEPPPPPPTPLPAGRAFRPILRWDAERKETYIEDPLIRRKGKGRYR